MTPIRPLSVITLVAYFTLYPRIDHHVNAIRRISAAMKDVRLIVLTVETSQYGISYTVDDVIPTSE